VVEQEVITRRPINGNVVRIKKEEYEAKGGWRFLYNKNNTDFSTTCEANLGKYYAKSFGHKNDKSCLSGHKVKIFAGTDHEKTCCSKTPGSLLPNSVLKAAKPVTFIPSTTEQPQTQQTRRNRQAFTKAASQVANDNPFLH